MGNFIDKIQISGSSYDVKDSSIDISQYWTSAQTQSAITEATSGKLDTSVFQTYSGGVDTALANKADTSAVTESINAAVSGKQDTLVSGTNIKTINNESILGSGNIEIQGGSDINVVQTTGTSTTDVMSQDAVTTQLNNKANKSAAVGGYQLGSTSGVDYIQYKNVANSNIGSSIYYPNINGKGILTTNLNYAKNNYNFQLVETSAITTSITSSSTDAQVPSAKAVYDALQGGGGGGGITSGEVQVMIDESISGKSDTSAVTEVNNALTAHTANTQIHVTTAQTAAWDAKSDFSGSYNDLTNKPTIPTTTSAVTSGSTDVVESGAVYDQMGGMKILHLTQAQYDALSPNYDNTTLYVITNS